VLPVSLAGSPPFTGLLDLSASTSIINWEAAALLGMACGEQQQQDAQAASGGSSSSSSGGDGGQQQQQQQQLTSSMYGYYGSIEVVPDSQLLKRPQLPQQQPTGPSDSSSNLHAAPAEGVTGIHLPGGSSSSSGSNISNNFVRWSGAAEPSRISSSHSGASKSDNGPGMANLFDGSSSSQYSPLKVQRHRIAASQLQLVLGHARLAAAAAAAAASSDSGSCSSLALFPPARLGVAGLRGLGQLGLAGQPVMVVGADVWARQRAVLCLKAGKLYLADRLQQR